MSRNALKIATIIGARPQFIKAAQVSRAIAEYNRFTSQASRLTEIIIHTGQHFDADMSDVFFKELNIPKPDYNLDINNASHGAMTGRMLEKIEEILIKGQPDRVLVYGDTNSTLAGALAGIKLHIPVAHVEAGLRSFNRRMPEEINRVFTDHASDLLFAPTIAAVENLKKEGIFGEKVVRTGDVMYDAALFYRKLAKRPDKPDLPDTGFILCTVHRAENTDDKDRLRNIFDALNAIAEETPVVMPVHPRTKKTLNSSSVTRHPSLKLIDPVGYLEMIWMLEHCRLVMTDSGGLQKEAYFFQKPCVTLRDETEWVELVEVGANVVVGANKEAIMHAFVQARDRKVLEGMLYGDGNSAGQIVNALLSAINLHH